MKNKKVPQIRFKGFIEDWEEKKLKELTKSFQYGLNAASKEYDGENKYIRITDIDENTREFKQNNLTSPNIDFELGNEYLLNNGDILFARTGASVGKSFIYKKKYGKVYFAGFLIRAKLFEDVISEFIFQNTLTTKYNNFVTITSQRSGQPGINANEYADYTINIPEKSEQEKIGNFFTKLDDLISNKELELETLKQTKQGFLQKMFPSDGELVPKIRFSGFVVDWEESLLGSLMTITSVKRIHQSDWTNKGIRFLRARDIVSMFNGEKIREYLYISKEKYEEYSSISGKVKINDLLVTGVGTIGIPYLIRDENPIYFKDGNIIWMKNNSIEGNFLFYSFIGYNIQKFIRDVAGKGTVGTYTIENAKKTKLILPTSEEQQKIGQFFKNLDDKISICKKELDLLKQTKKAFLQKMFI